ncbi:MAG: hypothetical protein ACJ790_19340 [Myxococcaceae bacterium]
MASLFDPVTDAITQLKKLTPANLKKLGNQRLSDLITQEALRSKKRVADLQERYPSADTRELCQRLVDSKKHLAQLTGGISGALGIFSVPPDMLIMAWLELSLTSDIATLYKVNLKGERGKQEVLDLFYEMNGIPAYQRESPKVLGKIAGLLAAKLGSETIGRALPLVGAPISMYFNSQHIQFVGEQAKRHFEGFGKAHEKTKKASAG